MAHMGSDDQFAGLKRPHREYKVFDAHYERVGNVDEIFVDGVDHPVYLGVSTGLLEMGRILIPMDIIRINDKRGVVEVDTSRAESRTPRAWVRQTRYPPTSKTRCGYISA